MKATLKVQGTIELSDEDLLDVVRTNTKDLSPYITEYIKKTYRYTPTEIQQSGKKIIAIINSTGEGSNFLLKSQKPKSFKRKWRGLYDAIATIVDSQRKRNKKFISLEDLHAELLEKKDDMGKKKFIQDGEELPMRVLKHRLNPSQIDRQAKRQKSLAGVRIDVHNDRVKL